MEIVIQHIKDINTRLRTYLRIHTIEYKALVKNVSDKTHPTHFFFMYLDIFQGNEIKVVCLLCLFRAECYSNKVYCVGPLTW